jgi:Zn-finger nucleic acid-binding protein
VRVPNPAIAEPPPRPECPRCRGRLLAIGIDASGAILHACSACRGLFVPPRAWCALVARPDLANDVERRLPAAGMPPGELVKLLDCPACGKQMERGRFAASSNVVIDVCVASHGVWLDGGELGGIVRHASQRAAVGAEAFAREQLPEQKLSEERMRHYARRPTPPLKQAKRAGGLIVLVIILVRLFYMLQAKNTVSTTHADDTARAIERANSALGQ